MYDFKKYIYCVTLFKLSADYLLLLLIFQELDLLSQLYGLFQKFIRFDNRFRDTLWADIDLDASYREVWLTTGGVSYHC